MDRVLPERLENDHARAQAGLEEAGERVVVELVRLPELLHDGRSASFELVDPVRDEAILEARHDGGVDDPEGTRDDGEEDEPELDGQPRMPELVHGASRNR